MLYLRTPFTILLSIMWFMGALPAPADANPLTHFFKKAAHTAIHTAVDVGKETAGGALSKAVLHAPTATVHAVTTASHLGR